MGSKGIELPEFHPATVIRDWGNDDAFHIADALTGVCVFGATGSGKTTGPARHLAYGYLAADFGGLVLCAKKEERKQWEKWAADCGREGDLVIIDSGGEHRFNFLDWEASRREASGGLTINIVAILDEIAGALARAAGKAEHGSGDYKFWEDALHHLNMNLVDLPLFVGVEVSLPLMRDIVNSAPQSRNEAEDAKWHASSHCAQILREAEQAVSKASPQVQDDFKECKNYWLKEFPALSEKTRSIITLSFSMLARPLITRPLRKLFSTDTNVRPEDTFNGKIIIVDLPVQDFRLAGRVASLVWKFCFQVAVLRRSPPVTGHLRPVFFWGDEAQNFITAFDAEYQAVARSAGGCTVYLTQNRESFRRVLGDDDAVDSLLANLQAKFFCQNTGDTNEWASRLLGERYVHVVSTSVGNKGETAQQGMGANVTRAEEKRFYIEPARFTTLKRGGALNQFQIETVVYNGGKQFPGTADELFPYKILTFNQK